MVYMFYRRPFKYRSPDFRRVQYEFEYTTPADAQAAYDLIRDKKYTLLENGDYVRPIGHRICAREERLDGTRLAFIGQLKAEQLPASPEVQALELEVAGTAGTLAGKVILEN